MNDKMPEQLIQALLTAPDWRDYHHPQHGTRACDCGHDPPDPSDFTEEFVLKGDRWFLIATCVKCGAVTRDRVSPALVFPRTARHFGWH